MPRLTQELQFQNQDTNPRAPYNGVAVFCKNGSLYTIDTNGIVALIGSGNSEPVDLSNYYTINETDNAISTAISTAINALINGAPGTLDTLKELADAVNSNKSLVDTLNEAITNKQDKLVSGTNIKTINGESILGSGDITISGGTGGTENAIPITGSSSLSGTFAPSVDAGANLGDYDKKFSYIYADNLGKGDLPINQACIDNLYVRLKIAPYSNFRGLNLGTDMEWFGGIYLGASNSPSPGCLIAGSIMDQVQTWKLPNASGTIALTKDLNGKQDKLVSGTNIKTINGESILGNGNITISGGSGANIDDSTISTSSTYSSSKIDSTYLKAPEGRLDIENGRVNLKNNPNSVYSITNNEVVMELNDDGLRYHDNATNLDVNITPYYGAIDQNVDPATIKVNGIGLARETDLNKKVSLRGDTMTGNLNAPAFTVDSTKAATGDKPLTDGAINFKYKNTNDEPWNAWLTVLPSGQLQFGSQGAGASEIGTVATQEWVNKKITNAYIYKGSVDTYDALPSSADPGFVYNVRSNGANYAWTGTEWDELGATVNLDAYALKTDLNGKQDTLVSGTNIKTINGTSILGTGDITISGGTDNAIPLTGSSSLSGNFSPSDDGGASLGSINKRFDYIYIKSLGSLFKSIDDSYINNISVKTNIKPSKKGSVYLGTDTNWFRGVYLGTPDSNGAGQLIPPATMTSGKTWQLPNADGTIALTTDIPEDYIRSEAPIPQIINSPLEIRDTLEVGVAANNTSHLKLRNTTDGNYVNVTVEEKSGINNTSYNLTLPLKTGTLATLDDIPSSGGSSGSGIQIYEQMPAPEEVTDGQIIAMPSPPPAVVDVVYNANTSLFDSGTTMSSGDTKTYNSTIGAKSYWMITYTHTGYYTNTLIVPCTGNDFYGFHYGSNSTYLRCNASTDGKSITLYNTGQIIYIHAVMAF